MGMSHSELEGGVNVVMVWETAAMASSEMHAVAVILRCCDGQIRGANRWKLRRARFQSKTRRDKRNRGLVVLRLRAECDLKSYSKQCAGIAAAVGVG